MQNEGNTANIFVNTELPQEMNFNALKPEVVIGEMPEHIIIQQPTPNIRQGHNKTLKREPTYSCLKNGSRPTFKEMIRNTVPVTNETFDTAQIQLSPMPVGPLPSAPIVHIAERTTKMEELKAKYKLPKKPTLEKRIKTYKYKLGKKDKNVSVLIKNNKTRRNVKMAHAELKKNSLLEIKKYLKAHNLLKAGSEAPSDVLRQLYEQTKLAGEINNNNSDNMLHNYLSK
jgi:hypothetical protein